MSEQRKWTLGPWVVMPDPSGLVSGRVGTARRNRPVAEVWSPDGTDASRLANARLIAAAPEMYEALRKVVLHGEFTRETLAEARAALAKADGK